MAKSVSSFPGAALRQTCNACCSDALQAMAMLKILEAAHDHLMIDRYQEYKHFKRLGEIWRDEGNWRFGAKESEYDQSV